MTKTLPQFHVMDDHGSVLSAIANFVEAKVATKQSLDVKITGLCSVNNPKPGALTFLQSDKNIDVTALKVCAAVIVNDKHAVQLPEGPVALVVDHPHNAFAAVARQLFPDSLGNARRFEGENKTINGAHINSTAQIEEGVTIEPGAVIGAYVEIGRGTYIGPNVTIGKNCAIGRNCSIGAGASVQYSLIGDQVTLHVGTRIGQDGFGFVPGKSGLEKMPQLGRVIIQDSVEIGANTTVDRGTLDDTMIGEGTKIDNLVQIGHNVVIGRHCAIAGFAGLSGSCRIGDGCLIGGRVGIADHIVVGDNVQLAATASVMNDIPSGERWAGTPAQPVRAFFREQATLRRLAKPNKK